MASRYLLVLLAIGMAFGQETAALSGQVVDPSQAAVSGAAIILQDFRRGIERSASTIDNGTYYFDSIDPGTYSITVRKTGFADLRVDKILLAARSRQSLTLEMKLAVAADSVTVEDQLVGISADASGGAAIEQDFLRHLPINGRGITALMQLAPGVVSGAGGGLNVNGLRSNANYYLLDGVSVGQGNSLGGGGGPVGGPGGGGPPGGGSLSSGLDALSLESLQEVRIQTSAFAPEFGRTPGAQVSMTSRSGTNQWHGSAYEYFRNHHLNANDWFANQAGIPRGRMLQHQAGATFGGRLVRNRTFFFAAGEFLRLRAPDTSVASVPDLTTRRSARANLRPYLNAFPLPNGPQLDAGAAQFSSVSSNPQNRESLSLRIDHALTARHALFARYSFSPSDSTQRGSDFISPNMLTSSISRSHAGTVSLISTLQPAVTNDLRINYSANSQRGRSYMDDFGGAVPLTDAQVFPAGINSSTGTYSLNILGLSSYSVSQFSRSQQGQVNIVDGITMVAGSHTYKLGLDLRVINSTTHLPAYSVSSTFNGLSGQAQSFLTGISTNSVVSSSLPAVYPTAVNWSLYLQDTFRLSEVTTLSYGIRWDINPAPTTREGPRPFAMSSANPERVTQSEGLYNTRWTDLAPRFGLSQIIDNRRGRELVLRGGIGVFHDLGYGASLSAFSGAPFSNARTLTGAAFPLASTDLLAPVLPATKPYNQLGAAERTLQSPRIIQWNATLEKSLANGQLLSLGYAGTRGLRLLRTETQPSFSEDYDVLRLATNGADSDYHALQAQYRRRYSRNLQLQASYTYSHSIDTASNDLGFGGGFATIFTSERGSSDFDVRHNLSVAGSYLLPTPRLGVVTTFLRDWWFDFLWAARTGMPFNVIGVSADSSNNTGTTATSRGLFAQVRPDYNGAEIWVDDPTAPGGRRLNRNAFSSPTGFGQGSLGRNSIAGYGLTQVDLTLRRELRFTETHSLHLSVQGFNIFNTTNFATPTRNEGANMTSANFGVPNRLQNQGIGGGLGSVFRSGGPRSLQLTARFQF
jgi:hypothetical protein